MKPKTKVIIIIAVIVALLVAALIIYWVTIKDIVVTDELEGIEIQSGEGYEVEGSTAKIAEMKPEAKVEITATYTVTSDDILAGSVKNTATGTGTDPEGEDPTVDPGEKEDPTEDLDTTLTVNKTISNEPADGEAFTLGETIEYTITVTNDGNVPYYNVVVTDELEGVEIAAGEGYTIGEDGTVLIETLAVEQTVTITATYTVTSDDILAGSVTNTAVAAGDPIDDPKDPENPKTPEGEDTVTTGDEDDPDGPTPPIDDIDTSMSVVKTETSTPVNPQGYLAGEVISYEITVTNEGNVPYTNVVVTDALEGAVITAGEGYTIAEDGTALIETLAVGQIVTVTATYTVTAADGAAGSVINTATATADPIDDPKDPENPKTPEGEGEVPSTTTQTFTLTIQYRYADTGAVAAPDYTITLFAGDTYRRVSPTIAGYNVDRPVVAGTMPNGNRTIRVFYTPIDTTIIIDDFATPLGLGNVSINVGECIE
ncbi:MAG: DUF11 domain-containing protein [Clostridia bacterium]|nr:DUF11 domain-containing protein [Clostridia bacterium]